MNNVRSENEIDKRIALSDFIDNSLLLHHTAAQSDYQIRIGLFEALYRTDIAVNSVLGVLTHGAGVVKNQVRLFNIVRKSVAERFKNTLDTLTVGNIALTTVCVDKSKRL